MNWRQTHKKKEHSTLYSYPTTLPRFHSLFLRALVSLCVALSPYLVVSAALVWCSFAADLKKICVNLKTRSYPSFDEFPFPTTPTSTLIQPLSTQKVLLPLSLSLSTLSLVRDAVPFSTRHFYSFTMDMSTYFAANLASHRVIRYSGWLDNSISLSPNPCSLLTRVKSQNINITRVRLNRCLSSN